jgi:type VI secretion system secreted protein VgrG
VTASDTLQARFVTENLSTLQIHRLHGREAIGRIFEFELEVVATRADAPKVEALIGAEIGVVLERAGEKHRHVHGIVSEVFHVLESQAETRTYRLRLVPRAFRLSMIEIQEIYMDQSVPDIIRHKLELVDLGSADVDFRLVDEYPTREFVVQYQESDLAFISRLAEHYGLSIFFHHSEDRDLVVITDGKGFRPLEGDSSLPFRSGGEKRDVYELATETKLIPANYVMSDYNYRTPQIDLSGSYVSPLGYAGGVVEYGAHFKTPSEGSGFALIRAQEREATRQIYVGRSDACALHAGAKFRLEGHGACDDVELLVVEVEHELVQSVAMHGGAGDQAYTNRFRAIEAGLRYRPPRATPKPKIPGLLTGIVEQEASLPPGQYARIDEQGRYVIRFLFDTAPAGERKASRPVRMLQPHAGTGYGMHFPLKPGVEVSLAFVNGDPDRPLIVGAVPNPETPSPVTVGNSLSNTLKTASGVLFEMKDR